MCKGSKKPIAIGAVLYKMIRHWQKAKRRRKAS